MVRLVVLFVRLFVISSLSSVFRARKAAHFVVVKAMASMVAPWFLSYGFARAIFCGDEAADDSQCLV